MADTNSTTTHSMSPIEYLERRVETLKAERPDTRAGQLALEAVLHELHNIIMALKIQAVNEVNRLIAEEQRRTPDAHLGAVIENDLHGGER